nr:MAG TPA: hypothetical protein [Caudoviricetes sp.]
MINWDSGNGFSRKRGRRYSSTYRSPSCARRRSSTPRPSSLSWAA